MGQRQRRAEAEEAQRKRSRRNRLLLRVAGIVAAAAVIGGVVLLRAGHQAAAATGFQIVSPAAGATVSSPVQVRVALRGARLGTPSTGLDHLHVSIDGGEPVALYQMPELSVPLAPGPHVIAVQLADASHEGILPVQTVSFRVGG